MNRFIPVVVILLALVVILLALVVAFVLSRPKPVPDSTAPITKVQMRILEGKAIPPQLVKNLHVALVVANISVADSPVNNGLYRLELPSQITVPLEPLKNLQLVHGDARLPDGVLGADTKLVMYDDQDKSGTLDSGEPQLEAALLAPNTDPALLAFFRHKIVLLASNTSLIETQDSATGAKGYYRYNLAMQQGWNILEGQLASNGYDIRTRSDNKWDILAALPAGGNATPPVFTPQ